MPGIILNDGTKARTPVTEHSSSLRLSPSSRSSFITSILGLLASFPTPLISMAVPVVDVGQGRVIRLFSLDKQKPTVDATV